MCIMKFSQSLKAENKELAEVSVMKFKQFAMKCERMEIGTIVKSFNQMQEC